MPQNLWPWQNPKALRESAQTNYAYNTNSATTSTVLTAANLTGGAQGVTLNLTGTLTAGRTGTTDTAANIVAAIPAAQLYPGYTYILTVVNSSSGAFAWTVAAGTGVTITGTATVAQDTWREFLVTVTATGTPAVTLQNLGTGTYS